MGRVISPPKDQFDTLRQPLTKGERIVFDFFDKYLDISWEIYVQPHLNGLRPDFVLLNPKVGIAVFEVKDWDLNSVQYFVKPQVNKPPSLWGRRDGKSFQILPSQNPVEKILIYKKEIYDLYCPRLKQRSGYGTITAGIIFPFASDENLEELFSSSRAFNKMSQHSDLYPLVGMGLLHSEEIGNVFPRHADISDRMTEALANDFRNWLVEPDFSATQRFPLELDKDQLTFVKTRTQSGYRRIKGPAGSGKSLILAARAVELASQGKDVLVVTYNITLLHYLMDLAVRWPVPNINARKSITWLNFHRWCKRMCQMFGFEDEYREFWRQHFQEDDDCPVITNNKDEKNLLGRKIPDLVSKALDECDTEEKYDAILVDEGQDFLPEWWNVMRKACKTNGEMLLVADATQDIYGRSDRWTDDAMVNAGFRGAWSALDISYRLPKAMIEHTRSFAQQFLPNHLVNLPMPSKQTELNIEPCYLKWSQINQTNKQIAAKKCADVILHLAIEAHGNFSIPDITFLTANNEFGREVVGQLKSKIRVIHTFGSNDEDSQRMKLRFYMGDARVKATTLHSFKGWESSAVVIYLETASNGQAMALLYTGLTRLKRRSEGSYLSVISCADGLKDYGKTWPRYEEI